MKQEKKSINPEVKENNDRPFFGMTSLRQGAGKYLSVGLDPQYDLIPNEIKHRKYLGGSEARHTRFFLEQIIKETNREACIFKLNLPHYLSLGVDGSAVLINTTQYIRDNAPEVPILIDVKAGDVEKTNELWAKTCFDVWNGDAVTVNPWVGSSRLVLGERKLGSLKPFLRRVNKGVFVWCKSSNLEAGELQDLPIDLDDLPEEYKKRYGDLDGLKEIAENSIVPQYQLLAYIASRFWNMNGNIGYIVGSTHPRELEVVREIVGGDSQILAPGIGDQEGNLRASVIAGMNSKGFGLIPSASESVVHAGRNADFASLAQAEAKKINEEINRYRLAA